jgi:hypothetical protein
MKQNLRQQSLTPKKYGDTDVILRHLDNTLAKFSQMRELLADPVVLAAVKQVINSAEPPSQYRAGAPATEKKPRQQSAIMRAALKCVQGTDDPFTKRDLWERMRVAGYTFKGNPKSKLHWAMHKFLFQGIIRLVEEGGGGGHHENKYQRNDSNGSVTASRYQSTVDHAPVAAADPRLRSEMERIALKCVEKLDEPFTTQDLINKMRVAGYTFTGDAGVSIQSALGKLLNMNMLEVAQDGAGRRPRLYRKKNQIGEERKGDKAFESSM